MSEWFRKEKTDIDRVYTRPTRFGAQIPEGWVSTPEYVGIERRIGERREHRDRRYYSRVGDGRIPRRSARGRRFNEIRGVQYSRLFSK